MLKKMFILITTALSLVSCDSFMSMDEPGNLVPKTVEEDNRLPSLIVNNKLLHGEAIGDISKPIMIFLHGGPGADYRAMVCELGGEKASAYPEERFEVEGIAKLKSDFYCFFYDRRGAGLSTRFEQGSFTWSDDIDDLYTIVTRLLDQKEAETGIIDSQVYLFGWSNGGMVAAGFANEYPELVRDIVMYEPGPFTNDEYKYFMDNMTSLDEMIGDSWVDGFFLTYDHFSQDSHERMDFHMLQGAFEMQPDFHYHKETPFWRWGAYVGTDKNYFKYSRDNITSRLGLFNGRVLFIGGSLTLNNFPEYMEMQMSYFTNTKLVIVEGVGHTGVWEKPDEIIDLVKEFI